MPVIGYSSNQFVLMDDNKVEKMPTMAIGSGNLIGDPTMPRLQFRSWMEGLSTTTTESAINVPDPLMPRSGLEMVDAVEPEITKIPDPDHVDYMTKSMLTFVLGSVALFLAAMLLILLVFLCVRYQRRCQARREADSINENNYGARKQLVYPVRSLDIPRRQLDEILRKAGADPNKANPLDF